MINYIANILNKATENSPPKNLPPLIGSMSLAPIYDRAIYLNVKCSSPVDTFYNFTYLGLYTMALQNIMRGDVLTSAFSPKYGRMLIANSQIFRLPNDAYNSMGLLQAMTIMKMRAGKKFTFMLKTKSRGLDSHINDLVCTKNFMHDVFSVNELNLLSEIKFIMDLETPDGPQFIYTWEFSRTGDIWILSNVDSTSPYNIAKPEVIFMHMWAILIHIADWQLNNVNPKLYADRRDLYYDNRKQIYPVKNILLNCARMVSKDATGIDGDTSLLECLKRMEGQLNLGLESFRTVQKVICP